MKRPSPAAPTPGKRSLWSEIANLPDRLSIRAQAAVLVAFQLVVVVILMAVVFLAGEARVSSSFLWTVAIWGLLAIVLALAFSNFISRRTLLRLIDLHEKTSSFAGTDAATTLRYRVLWESARDIIMFFRVADGKLIDVNDAAIAAYGYTREELLSKNIRDLRVPADRDELADQLERSSTNDLAFETRHQRKDGTVFLIDVKWQRVTLDGAPVIIAVARDITDRKLAEQERYRFFDLSLDLMVVATFDGYFVRLNPAWKDTLGFEIDEMMQSPFMHFVHPDDAERTAAALAVLGSGSDVVSFENRYRCKDGTYRWFLWSATPAERENVVYATARDITDRKASESALTQARDQAVEAHRLKAEFIANTTHEIRTPMNAVVGAAELLASTPLNEEQYRYVDILQNSSRALLGIINEILDFSKLEAGKMHLETTDVDLVELVEGAASLLEPLAAAKRLRIHTFVSPDIPRSLRGDPTKVRQVLINLASNAIKFTATGSIVIRATLHEASATKTTVHVAVSDTGIGLSPTAIRRLFQPFTQADGSTTRRFGGTGLGLTISKRLVELMGGALGVDSVEGAGSTFWFTIDFDIAPAAERQPRIDLSDFRALVVDADPVSAEVLCRYLTAWGASGTPVRSWEEALAEVRRAHAAASPYHALVVDSGADTISDDVRLTSLRREDPVGTTRTIILLPIDAGDRGRAAVQAGYFASIARPVRQSHLFECLAAAAQKRAPHADSAPFAAGAPLADIQVVDDAPLVLLVEDNLVNRTIALRQLDKLGYRVRAVENGQQAVEQVLNTRYDAVLMDCQMPVMDGFEATRKIRKLETRTGGRTPIIAMTANAMEGDRNACTEAGMDHYLTKPVTIENLRACLELALADRPDGAHATPRVLPTK